MKFSKEKIIKESKSILIIVLVVFSFRSMCFEPYRIPSGSMIPTLNIGDFIVVNKLSYGLKVPFSDMFGSPIYLTSFKSPDRGDVIVFKYPKNPSINYIKRVIGLPGDKISIVNKEVFINGKKFNSKEVDGQEFLQKMVDQYKREHFIFREIQDQNHKYVIQTTARSTQGDNIQSFTVPEGQYFVMGDNRDFSADSRYWGFVPRENIRGKASFVWLSITNPLGEHSFEFRPSRIGTLI